MNLDFINGLSLKDRYKLYLLLVNNSDRTIKSLMSIGYKVIDVGKELSIKLKDNKPKKHLNLFIQEHLETLIKDNTNNLEKDKNKKLVFLSNFGLLLEPDISFNTEKIIAEISKNTHTFLLWSGAFDQQAILSWKTQREQFNLDFSQYGIQTINLTDEI